MRDCVFCTFKIEKKRIFKFLKSGKNEEWKMFVENSATNKCVENIKPILLPIVNISKKKILIFYKYNRGRVGVISH